MQQGGLVVRVHHINCGSLRTVGSVGGGLGPAAAVCHCLVLETERDGLVLVDGGLGVADVHSPRERLSGEWVDFAEPVLDVEQTALRQVARLGFDVDDVRHIVLTHLHRDHTGALPDFPHATVHVHQAEYEAVMDPGHEHHRVSLERFVAPHHAHGPRWSVARPAGSWFGFDGAARLEGLSEEIVLVPLPGHTPGHSGVAVRVRDRWLLHAGDAYFYHGELTEDPPRSHPELQLVQDAVQVDKERRLESLQRLRDLHGDEVDIFCAHDPWEFRRMAGAGR